MSKYTTEIRYICEHLCGLDESKGYNDIGTIISNARQKIFNFDYPIFDEEYRAVLETKILKHYYTREIGEETVGLWKLRLDRKMNEIMPYFNQLYKANIEDLNPFLSVDMKTERSTVGASNRKTDEVIGDKSLSANSGVNETTTTSTSRGLQDVGEVGKTKQTDLYSETPQGSLTGVDEETYLTNARKIENDSITNGHTHTLDVDESSGTSSVKNISNNSYSRDRNVGEDTNTTERFVERTYGYNGYLPSDLIKKFREAILNIDLMIIDELEPLFMQLW